MSDGNSRVPTWKLKDGIDINDIVDGKGAEFEVAEGIEDEIDGEEEFENEPEAFNREEVFKNLNYLTTDGGSDDEDDDLLPFERLAKKMESATEDGGVKKMVLQSGSGTIVPAGSVVRVHYNSYLELSDEPCDSTRLRNRVERFRLGDFDDGYYSGKAIPGLSIAVATMKRGELSRFLISPQYAFGSAGCPPRIPGDATLMYEIELLSFVEKMSVKEIDHLTDEERNNLTWQNVKQTCEACKKDGNIYFNEQSYYKAQSSYLRAVNILEKYHLKNGEEEQEQQKLLLKLYLNTALCCLKRASYKPVITYSKLALEIDRNNVKALYQIGKALHKIGDFDRSLEYLKRAQRLKPNSTDIEEELVLLAGSKEKFSVLEKDLYKKMFSKPESDSTGNTQNTEAQNTTPKSDSFSSSLEDFRNTVRKCLIVFENSTDQDEYPFPNRSLSPDEICCIIETAEEFGFEVIQRGQDHNMKLLIKKKT